MDNTIPKSLLLALNNYNIKIIDIDKNMINLEHNYSVKIEGSTLFKLCQDGYVISPFSDIEEMCDFIKKDMLLS